MSYFSNLKKNRKDKGSNVTSLLTLNVNPSLQYTKDDKEMFLLFDTEPHEERRIVCYATKENLLNLLKTHQWLADATFFVSPSIFQQLWVVHGQFENKVLPMAYFLMSGATQDLYVECLTKLKEKMDVYVEEFLEANPSHRPTSSQGVRNTSLSNPSSCLPYYKDVL